MSKRAFLGCTAAAFALFSLSITPATAQEFPPRKPITMVVGFAPGGGSDTSARIIAKKLSEDLGQSVIVENRPGAGGDIAHAYVANATPDGSVILLGSIGPLSIAPHLMKLPYDPQRDLAPITMGLNFPNVLIVNPSLNVKTLAEFVALAKKKSLDFGSTGAGSASHLAGELFNQRAGIELVHIPYKGGSPAMVDLLGGRLASYFAVPSTAAPYIASGRVVALATTGPARAETLPNVPTIAESGYPGFSATNWYAFVAPGKTPAKILDGWNAAIVKVLKDPAIRDQLDKQGLTPMPGTREELARYIASESKLWGKVIQERHITAQ